MFLLVKRTLSHSVQSQTSHQASRFLRLVKHTVFVFFANCQALMAEILHVRSMMMYEPPYKNINNDLNSSALAVNSVVSGSAVSERTFW